MIVNSGDTQIFTVLPDLNYHIATVSGCGGLLVGDTFTTGPVTANCSVTATFAVDTNIVTPNAGTNGTIDPPTPQTVGYGATTSFILTPDTDFHVATVDGCGGTLAGNTFTTGPVTADCSVTPTFAINTFAVTPSAGANGSMDPSTPQEVEHGATTSFILTPDPNYHIALVSGCGGTLLGNTFTTGPVSADCTVTASFVIDTYTVTPNAGANGGMSPSVPQTVGHGGTKSFTILPESNYHIDTVSGCGGTLVGNTFTTGAVTSDCSVTASFAIDTFIVTPLAGANGSMSPSTGQTVDYGAATAFTITAAPNYHIDTVTGCGGALAGSTFTTGAVTANCNVTATFAINTFTVTPSAGANGSMNPSTPKEVDYGATTTFAVSADANYHIDTVSGCSGTLVGSLFTTGAITADCSVTATFAIDTHIVTPLAGANGSISPSTPQAVNHGATTAFTVTAAPNYHIDTVSGCSGSLVDTIFTTGAITTDCSVTATFAIDTFSVTPSAGANGSMSPSTPQTVDYGATTAFTVTADSTYHIDMVSGCDGTLVGNTFTTGAITADCTVTASFAFDTYTVTPVAGNNGTISPPTPQTVAIGTTAAFTVIPDAHYHVDTVIGCDGTLVGNTYTTAAITAACTVTATFASDTNVVSLNVGSNGSLDPSIDQTIDYGATTAFTVTADANYHIDTVSGCAGTLIDDVFTTGAITSACSVTATFAIDTFTVTSSAGANGSISPDTPQTLDYGTVTAFTVTADANYHIDLVSGCGGTLVGDVFTTDAISADCSVTATFAIDTFTVTPIAGANGSMSPDTPQEIDYGAVTAFSMIPDTGYHTGTVSGCGGTLAGNLFTTGPITANCSVTSTFEIDTFSLNIEKTGTGFGTVTGTVEGIDCDGECSDVYDYGTEVILTASPTGSSKFIGWTGDCTGTDPVCTVTVDQEKTVSAEFYSFPWNLFMPAILSGVPAP